MTPETQDLLQRAETVAAAIDLAAGAAPAKLAGSVAELLAEGDLSQSSPRALWNLLWLAADLTQHVDLYRAMQLFSSVTRLFERHLAQALTAPDERAQAAEMAFDFFLNRPQPPLAQARFSDVLMLLERVLRLPNRYCRRAALHGLMHLKQHASDDDRPRVAAVLDQFVDPDLGEYVRLARDGELP